MTTTIVPPRKAGQAAQLHDLTLGAGNFFVAGPGISLPVFTGGRIRSNIAVQTSRQRLREHGPAAEGIIAQETLVNSGPWVHSPLSPR